MLTFIPAMQLSSLEAAFLDKFSSESAQGNIAGAREGYQRLKAVEKVVDHPWYKSRPLSAGFPPAFSTHKIGDRKERPVVDTPLVVCVDCVGFIALKGSSPAIPTFGLIIVLPRLWYLR